MITFNDVKDSLLSKEPECRVSRNEEGSNSGLFVGRGRTREREDGNMTKSRFQKILLKLNVTSARNDDILKESSTTQ